MPVPRSRSEIDRSGSHQLQQRAFHGLVADMQAAQLVPGGSIAAEIILRPLSPHPLDGGKTFAVTLENGVRGRCGAKQLPDDNGGLAILPQAEIGPGAFLITLDQTLFRQKLEMTGDTGLRLAENFGKIGDGQIAGRQKRQQTKARRFAGRLQEIHQFVQTERHVCCTSQANQHIKISLCRCSIRCKRNLPRTSLQPDLLHGKRPAFGRAFPKECGKRISASGACS